ncbi:hypothetical protein BLX87_24210 [Bacillus sp. VT-16-64]|nr:hypothetical protein BLX87_24210 [Bacillus sp. VT-16-64]
MNNRYVLYDYLKFFRKKFWVFIVIPILIIAALYFLKSNQKPYFQGESLIFTNQVSSKILSNPDLVRLKYKEEIPEELKENLNVAVKSEGLVSFQLHGANEKEVKKALQQASKLFVKDLSTAYDEKHSIKQRFVEDTQAKIDSIEQAITLYNDKLNQVNISPKATESYAEIVLQQEKNLSKYKNEVLKVKQELADSESPQLVDVTTTYVKGESLSIKYILMGIVIGLQVALVMLIFWKYIVDARAKQK